jgi:hypothetical protein
MLAAGKARGVAKGKCEAEVRDIILSLWKHRASMPSGLRPLQDYEPVLRALESLDPLQGQPRYFSAFTRSLAKEGANTPAEKWLDVASSIDYGARTLISFCLTLALENVPGKSRKWLELAKRAVTDTDHDIKVLVALSEQPKLLAGKDTANPNSAERERLVNMRDRLVRLNDRAAKFKEYLDKRLAKHE